MMNAFPSVLKPSLVHFLHVTISHLSLLHPLYETHYLSSTSDATLPTSTGDEDSDVPSDLPGLVAAMMDFTTQAARRKGCREMFVGADGRGTPLLESSSVVALAYAMMTVDDVHHYPSPPRHRAPTDPFSIQEESWANDPNAFVADEDDEMVGCSVRISGIDFIAVRRHPNFRNSLSYDLLCARRWWIRTKRRPCEHYGVRSRLELRRQRVLENGRRRIGQ